MNSARISGAVAFILLMGLTIWGGTLHFLENGTTIVGESLSPADRNKQVLLDGLADGCILYFKIEDYRINRIIPGTSDPPHRVTIENWLRPDTGDLGELSLATVRDQDGGLLQYTQATDERYTTTFVSRGLAGKPLAGFCTTPSRRITVVNGVMVFVIRFNSPLLHR